MIKRFINTTKSQIANFNLKKDNRPLIMLVCILIAGVLWFANSLGKKYETIISVPIQYTNLPNNKVLLQSPPTKVQIRMEAYGAALVQYRIRLSINPLNFNVRLFTGNIMERDDKSEFKILTEYYLPQLSRQISNEIEVIEILPDTLHFVFDNIVKQKKKIRPNFELSFENQYFLSDSIQFTPDSVWVEGPQSIVDTLSFVYTRKEVFRDLNSPARRNIRLEEYPKLKIEPRRVGTLIPVSFYTEYIQSIPLQKFNVPDSLNLISFPGRVEIKCLVPVESYSSLTPASFIVGIDYQNIVAEKNTIPVVIIHFPSFVKSFRVRPENVEYIIEKRSHD